MASEAVGNSPSGPHPRRIGSVALLVAALYSSGLIAAGFLVPVYSTQSVSSSGAVAEGSATLVGENGVNVVVVLVIPLLVTLVAAGLLFSRRSWGLLVARILTAVLVVFNVLAILSIGVFVVPVTITLVIVCLTWPAAQRGPSETGQTRSESLR